MRRGPKPRPAYDRVIEKTHREGSCLVPRLARTHGGYAVVRGKDRVQTLAHIVVWEHFNGPIPLDERGRRIGHVAHTCHNPSCCAIEHLRHGSVSENQ